MPNHNPNPTGRVDIVASKLFERAVNSHPNPLVQFLGGMFMPEVESQFRQILGPGTVAGKLAKRGVERMRQNLDGKLAQMGYQEPVQAQTVNGSRPRPKYRRPEQRTGPTPKFKATATVNGKRVKFRPSKPGEYRGRVIEVDAEVLD